MSAGSPPSIESPPVPPAASGSRAGTAPRRGRESAHPHAFDGRASAFRRAHTESRNERRDRMANYVLLGAVVIGAALIVTERPYSTSGSGLGFSPTPPGPPIVVNFGTPSVTSVTCGAGGTAYVESVPWINSSQPVATGQVYVRLYEIWDGDFIADPGAVANVTSTDFCAGSPPSASALWYAVLTAPNGTNLLGYTEADAWTLVAPGPSDFTIANGSTLNLVTSESLAGTGRGIAVIGFVDESQIKGEIAL